MKDINLLRNEVNALKIDVGALHRQKQPTSVPSTCHIKVSFPSPVSSATADPCVMGNLLNCPVLHVTRITVSSFKVKILRNCLYNALQSSNPVSHLVNIWKSHIPHAAVFTKPSSQTLTPHTGSISIASWNCRGFHNSIPYIQHLFSLGVDILILQEHWLWPFQLAQLGSINKNYSFVAVCETNVFLLPLIFHVAVVVPPFCGRNVFMLPLSLSSTQTESVGHSFHYPSLTP